MAQLTNRELADMHFVYGFCNGNSRAAEREYQRKFPNKLVPGRQVFADIHRNLSNHEHVRGQGRPLLAVHNLENVLEYFENDPQISIRTVSRNTNLPRSTIGPMLRMQGAHPYHYQRAQKTIPADFLPGMRFSQWMLNNENELPNILWTDEATFTRNGLFNFHNMHHWADENPRVVRRSNFKHRFSVNMWPGIVGARLIGPLEMPDRLSAVQYSSFLQNMLGGHLAEVNLNVRRNIIYQHDGAPAHYGGNVRAWLDQNIRERLIERGGPIV